MVRRFLLPAALALAALIVALLSVESLHLGGEAPIPAAPGGADPVPEPVEEDERPEGRPRPVRVTGLVLDAATGRPLAGAEVEIRGAGDTDGRTETGAGGTWCHFVPEEHLADATMRITAPDYVPRTGYLSRFGHATLHRPPIVTRLHPAVGRLSGVVVGPDGRPVAGATVFNWVSGTTRVTDVRGEFRDFPWARHLNWLSVTAAGWPIWSERIDPGQEFTEDTRVRIVLPTAVAVRGLVVDDLGRPLEGARVRDDNDEWSRETHTDSEGRFSWPVAHLGYDYVTVEKAGYSLRWVGEEVLVHDRGVVRVVLRRNVVLAGEVRTKDGSDRPRSLIVETGQESVPLPSDGAFRFPDHPAGEIRLAAVRPAAFQSARYFPDDPSFTGERLEFVAEPGSRHEDLRLEIAPLDRLAGRVVDAASGRPVTGAETGHGLTAADGTFTATFPRSLAADYRGIQVTADGYLPHRAPFAPEVRLTPWREVDVRVLDPGGEPVAGFSFWPEVPHMSAWEIAAVTDASGVARCRVSGPGPSIVRFDDSRYPGDTFTIPKEVDRIDWQLEAHPVAVTIRVTDEAGLVLPDVRVVAGPNNWTLRGEGEIGLAKRDRGLRVSAPGREQRYIRPTEWEGREVLTVTLRTSAPVRGRVIDAGGRPLPDASVFVRTGCRDRTDGEGRFRIGGIAAGEEVHLEVWVDGWPEQRATATAGGAEVEVRLAPRGTIRVRIPGERATRAPEFYVFGGTPEAMEEWIESDTEDALRFARHEDGILTLSVPAGDVNLWLRVPPGLPRHYLGLKVPPAGVVNLSYDLPRLGRLTGTVLDPDGQPLEDADIVLRPCGYDVDSTDENGRFRFTPDEDDWDDPEFSIGPWSLVVDHHDFAPHVTGGLDLSRDRDLTIRLRKGGRLKLCLDPPPRRVTVDVLGLLEDHCFFWSGERPGEVRSSGTLPPGPLRIRIRPDEGDPVDRTVVIEEGRETVLKVSLD